MRVLPKNVPRRKLLWSIFNWGIWTIVLGVVCSQFLGIVWNSAVTYTPMIFGRSPFEPVMELPGFNDEAYTDRAVVCIKEVNAYVPKQLSKVLADPNLAKVVNDSSVVDGYRVVKRDTMILSPQIYDSYVRVCDRVAFTLSAIQDSCDQLGFNVTRDGLRIVDNIVPNATVLDIVDALPILILPFWDNTIYAHFVIPSLDGTACDVNLDGVYASPALSFGLLRAVPRSLRMNRTETWLRKTGGKWRHGWYEDTDGTPWISNMATSRNDSWLGVSVRFFDTLANKETDAAPAEFGRTVETWGKDFTTTSENVKMNQAFVSNGKRFGLFFYEGTDKRTTRNAYSLETFISNASIILLLFRWFVSMAALLRSYRCGVAGWQTTGIGCLSSSRAFNVLPVMLLPRLKVTLAVFCTTGCYFEGQQKALSDAWYAMYPGIVEILFFYYSLLNILGKITYRRFSDALFGPTLLFLWALHYFRIEMAQMRWFGINGRVSTVIWSADVDALKLTDFITTDVARRLNGNVDSLLLLKLVVLAFNLLPLLFGEKTTGNGARACSYPPCAIEQVLALRASTVGGLGRSQVYATIRRLGCGPPGDSADSLVEELTSRAPTRYHLFEKRPAIKLTKVLVKPGEVEPNQDTAQELIPVLLGYELNRLGYLVFGGKFLISYDDWYVLTSAAPLRVFERLWNYRINVYDVIKSDDGSYFELCPHARLCRLDEPQLRDISFYDITLCSFK